MKFLDNSESSIWDEDYNGSLLPKGSESFDQGQRMDEFARQIGFNTRVVAFFFDKKEYEEEIKFLTTLSLTAADRYNLRIELVTDQKLIQKMKKSHASLFLDVGLSVMVLKRYDGAIFKLNVAEELPDSYSRFIIAHTVRPVE